MDPAVRAEAESLLKFAEKYETIDMRDVICIQDFNDYRQYYCPLQFIRDLISKKG